LATIAAGSAEHERMLSMITGFWVSQTVAAVADLSIAEHLEGGPLSAEEIASRENSDPGHTFRLMRACASLGLLAYQPGDGKFVGTALLGTLRGGSVNSLREMALVQTSPGHWLPWGKFSAAVREGRAQTHATHGVDIFSYFSQNPDEAALFSSAMTNLSSPVIREAVLVIDMCGVDTVVDVGGANGAFVLELMDRVPQLRGAVFDLPHVVPGAADEARRRNLSDRFGVVAGDFFESVPAADMYLLKYILHDWDHDACIKILENCRRAMPPGARIIVLEMLMAEIGEPGIGALMDMNMLAMLNGRERGLGDFDELLEAAGLRRTNLTAIKPPYHVIEAVAK
jgi:hypothetical protein